eukprot:g7971.t1
MGSPTSEARFERADAVARKQKRLNRKLRRPGGAASNLRANQVAVGRRPLEENHEKYVRDRFNSKRLHRHNGNRNRREYKFYDFPKVMVAIVGPGGPPGIERDIADHMGWYYLSLEDLLVHCNDSYVKHALHQIAQGLPVQLNMLYKSVAQCIYNNSGNARVLLSGFGEELRGLQELEKVLVHGETARFGPNRKAFANSHRCGANPFTGRIKNVGVLHFDCPMEKRAERLSRRSSLHKTADGQVRVRGVLNKFRDQLHQLVGCFKGLGVYAKVDLYSHGTVNKVKLAMEEMFPKQTTLSVHFNANGTEIYTAPESNFHRQTRDIGVQTADRPFSPIPEAHKNLTGHSVAWRNPSVRKPLPNEEGWGRVDALLGDAEKSLATLGTDGLEVGNYLCEQGPGGESKHVPTTIEYGSHTILDPSLKMRNTVEWLNSLQITKAGHPDDWDRTFSNGYLLGQILQWYYPVDVQMSLFQANYTTAAKRHNFQILKTVIQKRQLGISQQDTNDLMNAILGSAVKLLTMLHAVVNPGEKKEGGAQRHPQPRNKGKGRHDSTQHSLWDQQQRMMIARTESYIGQT